MENNAGRLVEDHENAEILARGAASAGFQAAAPSSNMVYLEVEDAAGMAGALERKGVRCLALGPTTIRMVTHLDVTREQVKHAVRVLQTL